MNPALMTDELFGIRLDDTIVADLVVADDVCLLEDDRKKSEELLDWVTKWAAKTGVLINVSTAKALKTNDIKKLTYNGEKWECAKL